MPPARKRRIVLVHWHAGEAAERARRLRQAGYIVAPGPLSGPAWFRALRERPPDAVLIDLGRLPSHGRDIAVALRHARATRHLPIVFVDGDAAKVAKIRALLPDAACTTWRAVGAGLARAIANPPVEPVVPASGMAGYSGTPLPKKLGIREGTMVLLVRAPDDFLPTLGPLPGDVVFRRRPPADVTLWFVRAERELEQGIAARARAVGRGGLWIAWPKQASGVRTDVTQLVVRRIGLASGLVDDKVAAIDATWSGLRFRRRRS